MPSTGNVRPPMINATIFAIGIKTITGRKTIACAFGGKARKSMKRITMKNNCVIYNMDYI